MTDSPKIVITDVLQISAATGWWFFDQFIAYGRKRECLTPVVCFALVEAKGEDGMDGPTKHTIPIGKEHFRRLEDVIGMDVYQMEDLVFHDSELERIRFDDDEPGFIEQVNVHEGNETTN